MVRTNVGTQKRRLTVERGDYEFWPIRRVWTSIPGAFDAARKPLAQIPGLIPIIFGPYR